MDNMRRRLPTVALTLALVACITQQDTAPPTRPEDVRALIVRLLPSATADRAGWATDIYAALLCTKYSDHIRNLCAVLAITPNRSRPVVRTRRCQGW